MNRAHSTRKVGARCRTAALRSAVGHGSFSQLSALSSQPPRRPARAFSLLEVLAAVAIFAVGMVGVLGLFVPVTKSVSNLADAEAAARVTDAVRARLQSMPFAEAALLLQDPADVRKNDLSGTYNPNDGTKNPKVIFGKLSGEIGLFDSATGQNRWRDSLGAPLANADKFFEIELIRDADRTTDILLAYSMRVRWPSFLPAANGAVQVGASVGGPVPFDHGKKQVLFFNGAVSR